MKNRFKSKRKMRYRFLLIPVTIIFTMYILISILFDGKTINLKEIFLNSFLNELVDDQNVFSEYIDFDFTAPENIIYTSLNKIVSKKDIKLTSSDEYFDYENAKSDYVEDTKKEEISKPIVYIYNSHQLEEYNMEVLYDYSIKPNVLIASYILREKLSDVGIPAIVETNNIKKYLNDNNLKYNYSYVASRFFAKQMLDKEPSIEYLIDIHRDSAKYNKTLYIKDNKKYARILFVVGLDHNNYEPNLDMATKLNNMFNELYPGFSRGISKKTGKGVNGIYNQDLSEKTMLLEVGGVDNTIEEVNNSIDIIVEILNKYITGEQ